MTNSKRFLSGMTALIMACGMMCADLPAVTGGSTSSSVITADAYEIEGLGSAFGQCFSSVKKASVKRSGKHTIYISHIGITTNALTVCMNGTGKDIEFMEDWLSEIMTATSGFKNASKVISLGKKLGRFGAAGKILTIFNFIFKSFGGVSTSARNARRDLIKMAEKYPTRGLKLTIKQKGAWKVELQ